MGANRLRPTYLWPSSCGQTISQPCIMAVMKGLLEFSAGGRLLEAGAGPQDYSTLMLRRLDFFSFGSFNSRTPSLKVAFAFSSSTSDGSITVRE